MTLFASGDSVTSAQLVACTKEAIRLSPAIQDHVPHYMIMLDKVRRSSHLFDILHFHIDVFHMPLFRDVAPKHLRRCMGARKADQSDDAGLDGGAAQNGRGGNRRRGIG